MTPLDRSLWRRALDSIEASEVRSVPAEPAHLPRHPPDRWLSGYRLKGVLTAHRGHPGTPAPGALDGSSVVVTSAGRVLDPTTDYVLDATWGGLGHEPEMPELLDPVAVSYRYGLRRIDSLVKDADGRVRMIQGMSHLTAPRPPELTPGTIRLANAYLPYFGTAGTALVLPARGEPAGPATKQQDSRLPRFRSRIDAGLPVRVTCWGDSVTAGGDATSDHSSYPAVVERALRTAHPGMQIEVAAVAVGGSNTTQWLSGTSVDHDWSRVVDSEPDVVTVEFVNDAGLEPDEWAGNYAEIERRTSELGADLVLTTPHWVMPSWMELTEDGRDSRPYVSFLRSFAERRGIALADVSARWERLKEEGLPYETLLNNGINHPDDRGHALAGQEIAAAFGSVIS